MTTDGEMTVTKMASAEEIASQFCREYRVAYVNAEPELAERIRAAEQAAAAREREACADLAHRHGRFCRKEADNGGCNSLYERAAGAHHVAAKIRQRGGEAG